MALFSGEPGGLMAALRGLLTGLLISARTRLALLANEVEEEKLRLVQLFLLISGAIFCLFVGVIITVLFFTLLFWESRWLLLGLFSLLFWGLGLLLFLTFQRQIQRPEPLFAESIGALDEDIAALNTEYPPDSAYEAPSTPDTEPLSQPRVEPINPADAPTAPQELHDLADDIEALKAESQAHPSIPEAPLPPNAKSLHRELEKDISALKAESLRQALADDIKALKAEHLAYQPAEDPIKQPKVNSLGHETPTP